ncbi:transmembrane and death domain protein 1 isoform X2 [Perca flavescens]|uniref:transmembrane and death domain protein 1 isoform X2 n=1 Tax=Perca flavescens TaxID=8167 RepID=UPI00106ED6FA|nr:uncharacterized protein C12orf81-like isoform X2 [Perca flavescens]
MYGAYTTSADMKVWKLSPLFFFLLLSSTLGEDTVAEDISVNQLERLVEMLTSTECKELLFALSHPEENIFQHVERLSPQKNTLDLKPRAKRDAASAAEVGKNINQDKALSLKRYVEDYHKYVNSLNFPPVQLDTKGQPHEEQKARTRTRRVRDLTWRDLDLIVERAPVAVYQKGPMDAALPLLYGILLGFGGTFLAGVSILAVIVHISRRKQQSCHRRVTGSPSSKLMVGNVILKDAASVRSEAAK